MEPVTRTLEKQHRALERMVADVGARLAAGDAPGVAAQLPAFRRAHEAHVELEALKLYPVLLRVAELKQLEGELRTARLFSSNLGRIAEATSAFLARWEGKPLDLAAFGVEWRRTVAALGARLQAEEGTLHPLFDRLVGA